MSKIGKLPISIKNGTNVTITNREVKVAGPKGEAIYTLPQGIKVTLEEDKLVVLQEKKGDMLTRPAYGLSRALLANMVKGVEAGFEKKLELVGVGYRAQMQGNDLVLSLGFSHPVKVSPLEGLKLSVAENVITVSGTDKSLVGELAAKIRSIREPEPYKGKGIKYVGEVIKRKAGKAAKAVGGK